MKRPIAQELHLDPRKVPAQVFNRIVRRPFTRKNQKIEAEKAWYSFGKPGRDPSGLSSVIDRLAVQDGWTSHLKIAQLQDHWDQIVGPAIAQHSRVLSYEQGRLVIQARTTVWATQLTYLVPQLKGKITDRIRMPVDEIVVTGPRNYQFAQGPYTRANKGRAGRYNRS